MIQSMTGFCSESVESVFGRVMWELRSQNHRYLDCNFRLPDRFLPLLPSFRRELGKHFHRGKIDVTLHFTPGDAHPNPFDINKVTLKWFCTLKEKLAKQHIETASFNIIDILRWPGVLLETQETPKELHASIVKSFEKALTELKVSRQTEGEVLSQHLNQHLTQMETDWSALKALVPAVKDRFKARLLKQIQDTKTPIDPTRLEQELVLAVQKIDVTEETERFEMHLAEVRKVLEKGGEVGKRLDFLMQELNREVNTLSAKSPEAHVGHLALNIKVTIEKMREQIQNVE